MRQVIKGIDVSHHNVTEKVNDIIEEPGEAISFIMIKLTEGKTYVDTKIKEWMKLAIRHGLIVGFYHYCRPELCHTPYEEVQHFVDVAKMICDEFEYSKPVVLALDYEDKAIGYEEWLMEACREVERMTGKPPMIYTNMYGANRIGNKYAQLPVDSGLWLATRGKSNVPCPMPWNFVAMWQYEIDGKRNIDKNIFFGVQNQLREYAVSLHEDWRCEECCCPHCPRKE